MDNKWQTKGIEVYIWHGNQCSLNLTIFAPKKTCLFYPYLLRVLLVCFACYVKLYWNQAFEMPKKDNRKISCMVAEFLRFHLCQLLIVGYLYRTVSGRSSNGHGKIFIHRLMTVRVSTDHRATIDQSFTMSSDDTPVTDGQSPSFVNTRRPGNARWSTGRPRQTKNYSNHRPAFPFFHRCSDIVEIIWCPDIQRWPKGMWLRHN